MLLVGFESKYQKRVLEFLGGMIRDQKNVRGKISSEGKRMVFFFFFRFETFAQSTEADQAHATTAAWRQDIVVIIIIVFFFIFFSFEPQSDRIKWCIYRRRQQWRATDEETKNDRVKWRVGIYCGRRQQAERWGATNEETATQVSFLWRRLRRKFSSLLPLEVKLSCMLCPALCFTLVMCVSCCCSIFLNIFFKKNTQPRKWFGFINEQLKNG